MLQTIRKILAILSSKERRYLVIVFGGMLVMGVTKMAGIGIVVPFVAVIANPGIIQTNSILQWTYSVFGFTSANSYLVFLAVVMLAILLIANTLTIFISWNITRFTLVLQRRLAARLLDDYLHQPYENLLNRNSADTGKNILNVTGSFTKGALNGMLTTLNQTITVLFIVGFLVWLSPAIALGAAVAFGGTYLLIYGALRGLLLRLGQRRLEATTARFKSVYEAFGSVKEVKVLGREKHFTNRHIDAANKMVRVSLITALANQVPRYLIQCLAYVFTLGAIIYLIASDDHAATSIPTVSAFAVGAYRLLPMLQQIYVGFAGLRLKQADVDTLYTDLVVHRAGHSGTTKESKDTQYLPFKQGIHVHNLTYHYPRAKKPALDNISLAIPRNSFVAFTGHTGAGKTTLVDIILGLLAPSSGQVCIDKTPITPHNLRSWQANIGYVPQEIYLTDASVANNIAYGLPPKLIDYKAVERAARIANIHHFITDDLPNGYNTFVGERGVRLSGGQRQRIGIARALYHDPSVIVLDEATSALDNETERRIVNELDAMRGGRTLIVIAHRLTTVQKCHTVFLLDNAKIAASGTYDELVQNSAAFGHLADTDNQARKAG